MSLKHASFLIRSLSGYTGGFDFFVFNHQNTGEQCACQSVTQDSVSYFVTNEIYFTILVRLNCLQCLHLFFSGKFQVLGYVLLCCSMVIRSHHKFQTLPVSLKVLSR